jgi:hypothetical protein
LAVIDDVLYNSIYHLTFTSNNNVLLYADVKNDTTGNINLNGLSNVIVGTGIGWLPIYGLTPLPVFPPTIPRGVEVGSLMGNTVVDAAIYAAVVAPTGFPGGGTQLGRKSGSTTAHVTVLAGNFLVVQASDIDSYAMIGFGGPSSGATQDVDIFVNVEEGNIWVTGGSENAFAQIGNRNIGAVSLDGRIDVIARSVAVNTPTFGNTTLQGGTGLGSEARIGHVHSSPEPLVTVQGNIMLADSSSIILRSGSGLNANAIVGHSLTNGFDGFIHGPILVEAKLWDIILDASASPGFDSAFCQIGHRVNTITGHCHDSIYLHAGGSVSCFSGSDMMNSTQIGHYGHEANDILSGRIDIDAGDSLVLKSDIGPNNYAQIGHRVRLQGLSQGFGNISIRTGGRQLYDARKANEASSLVQVGHSTDTLSSDIFLLAFNNIDLWSSSSLLDPAEAVINGWDTIQLISNDSINIRSNEANAVVQTNAPGSIVRFDAKEDISLISFAAMEASVIAPHARQIRCRSAGNISLSQQLLDTDLSNGTIWIEADKEYFPDSLFVAQKGRNGSSGPFSPLNLGTSNMHIFADLLGVVKFENHALPTQLSTINGNIVVRSKSTSVDGQVTDLNISGLLPFSLNPLTQNGKILIGFGLDVFGQPVDLGDSYQNGRIEEWSAQNTGLFYFNVNNHIDVFTSLIDMKGVVLETN